MRLPEIGVIGHDAYIPWHPEGIIPYQLWNGILTRFPDAGAASWTGHAARGAPRARTRS